MVGDSRLLALARALIDDTAWMHRRVETVRILDADRIERRVTLDFTPPRYLTGGWVPIAYLRKGLLAGFDFRDGTGQAIPMLTKAQSAAIEAKLLAVTLKARSVVARGAVAELLEALVSADSSTAAAADAAVLALLGSEVPEAYRFLSERLVGNFLLLVPYEAGRQLKKFSYLAGRSHEATSTGIASMQGHASLMLDESAPLLGGTRHLEVEAPPDLELRPSAGTGPDPITVGSTTHFYLPAASDAPPERLWLVPAATGFPTVALVLALAVLAMLEAFLWLRPMSSSASLLMALPGLYTIVLARPTEHGLARELLSSLRGRVFVTLLIPLGVAIYLSSSAGARYSVHVLTSATSLASFAAASVAITHRRIRTVPVEAQESA